VESLLPCNESLAASKDGAGYFLLKDAGKDISLSAQPAGERGAAC